MKRKFPFYKQMDMMDCGPTCLRMIAKFYGKIYSTETLREKSHIMRDGVSMGGIAEAAESIGMQSLAVSVNYDLLASEIPLPSIAYWRQRHFVVVYEANDKSITVADPAFGIIKYSKEDFIKGWVSSKSNESSEKEGLILVLEPTPDFVNADEREIKTKNPIRFLLSYFTPYRKFIFQLLLGLLVGSLIQLTIPFLTQAIVDVGINFQNLNFIYLVLLAQIILFISETTVGLIRGWLLLHITSRVNIRLISTYLMKLMRLPLSFFDSKNVGDLLQRIQDNNRIQQFISSESINIIYSVFNILIFGFVLAYYSTKIFLVYLFGAILYTMWVLFFMKRRAVLDHMYFDQASGNQSSMIQLINGMQEIKLNNSERRRRWEWEAIQIKLFKISVKGLSLSQFQNTGATFINQISNLVVTFLSAKLVIEGEITLGMMLSIQYILGQLNLPINNFVQFVRSWQDAKLSLERLSEIYQKDNDEHSDQMNYIPASVKGLRLNNVSFRYGGSNSPLVLKNLTFEIPKGKVTAVVGESGSGKTTLLKLLLRFYPVTEGNIFIGNTDIKNINPGFWRSRCGTVMQDGFIFSDTISRNISESDPHGMIKIDKLLEASKIANVTEFVDELPNGYNTRIGASGISLSGGQRQRVQIARAVYKNPDFIFFDEATSALDSNNEKLIMENLEQFFKKKTVLVVAHRLSTVKKADKIIVLRKGELVEQGTHKELIALKGNYFELVKNQLELGE